MKILNWNALLCNLNKLLIRKVTVRNWLFWMTHWTRKTFLSVQEKQLELLVHGNICSKVHQFQRRRSNQSLGLDGKFFHIWRILQAYGTVCHAPLCPTSSIYQKTSGRINRQNQNRSFKYEIHKYTYKYIIHNLPKKWCKVKEIQLKCLDDWISIVRMCMNQIFS